MNISLYGEFVESMLRTQIDHTSQFHLTFYTTEKDATFQAFQIPHVNHWLLVSDGVIR